MVCQVHPQHSLAAPARSQSWGVLLPPVPPGYQGCRGEGDTPPHPRCPRPGQKSFLEIRLGLGVPNAWAVDPANAKAGFRRAGGISQGEADGCVSAPAAVPAAGSERGVSPWWGGWDLLEGQPACHPQGWRAEDQAAVLVATGGTWDGGTCAPTRSVPPAVVAAASGGQCPPPVLQVQLH